MYRERDRERERESERERDRARARERKRESERERERESKTQCWHRSEIVEEEDPEVARPALYECKNAHAHTRMRQRCARKSCHKARATNAREQACTCASMCQRTRSSLPSLPQCASRHRMHAYTRARAHTHITPMHTHAHAHTHTHHNACHQVPPSSLPMKP